MPQYGAKNLQWASFAASNPEPEDALPNYGTPMKLGDLMSVAETLNFSEVESRADDVRKIYLREFVDGSLAVGVLELPNETASAVTGAQIDRALASDRGIHTGDKRGGNLNKLHAAQKHRRGKPRDIADNTAAERDYHVASGDALFREKFENRDEAVHVL